MRAGAGRSGKSAASPRCGALVCAGEFARAFFCGSGRAWEGRRTLAALGEPIRQAKVLRPTSYGAGIKGLEPIRLCL